MSVGETVAAAVVAVGASIALSGLLHEFAEKPAERWLRSRAVRNKPSAVVLRGQSAVRE
jgi:peptidoglycan/LPS O-acetylase OafA/YrhL